MQNVIKTMRLVFFLLTLLPSIATAYSMGPIEGSVAEEETNAPLPNAIITVTWIGRTTGESACLHSAWAFSDAAGKYRIAEWRHPARVGRFASITPMVAVYLAGYTQVLSKSESVALLARDQSDKRERLETLERLRRDTTCATSSGIRRTPSPMPSALFDEAKALVDETSNPEALEPFQFEAEVQQYGEPAAKRRQKQRRGSRQ